MCDLDIKNTCKHCENYGICPHSWDEFDSENRLNKKQGFCGNCKHRYNSECKHNGETISIDYSCEYYEKESVK